MRPGNGRAPGTGLGNLLSMRNTPPAASAASAPLPSRPSLLDELASVFPSSISPPESRRPDLGLPAVDLGRNTRAQLADAAAAPAPSAVVPIAEPTGILRSAWAFAASVPKPSGKRSWAQYFSGTAPNAHNLSAVRAALKAIFENELKTEYKPSPQIEAIIANSSSAHGAIALRIKDLGTETYAQKFFLLRMYRLYIDTLEKQPDNEGAILMFTNRLMEDILIYTYLNTLKEDEKAFLRSRPEILRQIGEIYNSESVIHESGFIKNTNIPVNLLPTVFAEALNQFLAANAEKARAFLLEPGSPSSKMPVIAGTRGADVPTRLAQLGRADEIYKAILHSRAAAFGNSGASAAGVAAPNYSSFGSNAGPPSRAPIRNASGALKSLTDVGVLNSAARGLADVSTRAAAGATNVLGRLGSAAGSGLGTVASTAANYASKGASKVAATAPGLVSGAAAAIGSAASELGAGTLRVASQILPGKPSGPIDESDESEEEGAPALAERLNNMGPPVAAVPAALAVSTSTGSNGQSLKRRRTGPGPTNGNNNGNGNGYGANRNYGGGRRTVKRKGRNARKSRKSRKARKTCRRSRR